jgi:tetratricopeptide (TPR) repeat protein
MSWSDENGWIGGSASRDVTPSAIAAVTPSPVPESFALGSRTLDDLRALARDTYARGGLARALEIQQRVLDGALAAGDTQTGDFMFLGLLYHGARDLDRGIKTLRDGLARFPDDPAMLENLAVLLLGVGNYGSAIAACEQALSAGSQSPNVHDCLCDAYSRIGRNDAAVPAGRAALEAKDRTFGARAPLVVLPDRAPPPFNPFNPRENVIAYCLWGTEPRYQVPLMENVRILPHLFPGWIMRVYHDSTVEARYLGELAARGVELRPMELPSGVPVHRKLLWRFDVIADPSVARFLIRDADSLLTTKERVAVDAWLQSTYHFHAMRDWYSHTDLLLAGMWGGVGNLLPGPDGLMQAYTAWRVENDHVDQDVLSETVWPCIRRHVLIHDSIFTGCLGSVPFPPYGTLLPGTHVGQNAFLHFTRAG